MRYAYGFLFTKNASLRARINIGQPTKIINTR
ncbi:IS200/IS605 family transposase, partial [Staphylococcus aureus]